MSGSPRPSAIIRAFSSTPRNRTVRRITRSWSGEGKMSKERRAMGNDPLEDIQDLLEGLENKMNSSKEGEDLPGSTGEPQTISHEESPPASEPMTSEEHFRLAHALTQEGKYDESIRGYREAIRLRPKKSGG